MIKIKKYYKEHQCPIEATIYLIGGKYKAVILWSLRNSTLRFNELQKIVPTATSKVLTQQLRELESDGLIERLVYPVYPPKVEYFLSKFGISLIPVLNVICEWGFFYIDTFEIKSN